MQNDPDINESIHTRRKVRRGCTKSLDCDLTIAAEVEIVPLVRVNKSNLELERAGLMTVNRDRGCCPLENTCKFTVQQGVTVRVPIHFLAKAKTNRQGIVCDVPTNCINEDHWSY